jgi:hypothetical protein
VLDVRPDRGSNAQVRGRGVHCHRRSSPFRAPNWAHSSMRRLSAPFQRRFPRALVRCSPDAGARDRRRWQPARWISIPVRRWRDGARAAAHSPGDVVNRIPARSHTSLRPESSAHDGATLRLHPAQIPSVAELLSVDREYRQRARAGALRRIAPRHHNPTGDAWLPILHTARGETRYTALYSNTELAHRLGRTDDWVVLYWDRGDGEQQNTVVTETGGPLRGRRVVRGRERECVRFYSALERQVTRRGARRRGIRLSPARRVRPRRSHRVPVPAAD